MSSTAATPSTTTPQLLPGIPTQPTGPTSQLQQRLVPALIGPANHPMSIHIPCPTWCRVDHTDRESCLEDVMHYGDCGTVAQVPTMLSEDAHGELMSAISSDPTATDPRLKAAHIVVVVGETGTDAYLDPSQAEQLADDLDAFAKQLRRQAATARAHNAAAEVQS